MLLRKDKIYPLGRNEYEIERTLGGGVASDVYLARPVLIPDERVIIKLPLQQEPDQPPNPVHIQALRNEIESLSCLNRAEGLLLPPGANIREAISKMVVTAPQRRIIAMLDSGEYQPENPPLAARIPFIVMELGPDEYEPGTGAANRAIELKTARLALEIARAVQLAHEHGIALKDFDAERKGDRIRVMWIDSQAGTFQLKIIDWNITGGRDDFPADLAYLGLHFYRAFTGCYLPIRIIDEFPVPTAEPESAPGWRRLHPETCRIIQALLAGSKNPTFAESGRLSKDLEWLVDLLGAACSNYPSSAAVEIAHRARDAGRIDVAMAALTDARASANSADTFQIQSLEGEIQQDMERKYSSAMVGAMQGLRQNFYSLPLATLQDILREMPPSLPSARQAQGLLRLAQIGQTLAGEYSSETIQGWDALHAAVKALENRSWQAAKESLQAAVAANAAIGETAPYHKLNDWAEWGAQIDSIGGQPSRSSVPASAEEVGKWRRELESHTGQLEQAEKSVPFEPWFADLAAQNRQACDIARDLETFLEKAQKVQATGVKGVEPSQTGSISLDGLEEREKGVDAEIQRLNAISADLGAAALTAVRLREWMTGVAWFEEIARPIEQRYRSLQSDMERLKREGEQARILSDLLKKYREAFEHQRLQDAQLILESESFRPFRNDRLYQEKAQQAADAQRKIDQTLNLLQVLSLRVRKGIAGDKEEQDLKNIADGYLPQETRSDASRVVPPDMREQAKQLYQILEKIKGANTEAEKSFKSCKYKETKEIIKDLQKFLSDAEAVLPDSLQQLWNDASNLEEKVQKLNQALDQLEKTVQGRPGAPSQLKLLIPVLWKDSEVLPENERAAYRARIAKIWFDSVSSQWNVSPDLLLGWLGWSKPYFPEEEKRAADIWFDRMEDQKDADLGVLFEWQRKGGQVFPLENQRAAAVWFHAVQDRQIASMEGLLDRLEMGVEAYPGASKWAADIWFSAIAEKTDSDPKTRLGWLEQGEHAFPKDSDRFTVEADGVRKFIALDERIEDFVKQYAISTRWIERQTVSDFMDLAHEYRQLPEISLPGLSEQKKVALDRLKPALESGVDHLRRTLLIEIDKGILEGQALKWLSQIWQAVSSDPLSYLPQETSRDLGRLFIEGGVEKILAKLKEIVNDLDSSRSNTFENARDRVISLFETAKENIKNTDFYEHFQKYEQEYRQAAEIEVNIKSPTDLSQMQASNLDYFRYWYLEKSRPASQFVRLKSNERSRDALENLLGQCDTRARWLVDALKKELFLRLNRSEGWQGDDEAVIKRHYQTLYWWYATGKGNEQDYSEFNAQFERGMKKALSRALIEMVVKRTGRQAASPEFLPLNRVKELNLSLRDLRELPEKLKEKLQPPPFVLDENALQTLVGNLDGLSRLPKVEIPALPNTEQERAIQRKLSAIQRLLVRSMGFIDPAAGEELKSLYAKSDPGMDLSAGQHRVKISGGLEPIQRQIRRVKDLLDGYDLAASKLQPGLGRIDTGVAEEGSFIGVWKTETFHAEEATLLLNQAILALHEKGNIQAVKVLTELEDRQEMRGGQPFGAMTMKDHLAMVKWCRDQLGLDFLNAAVDLMTAEPQQGIREDINRILRGSPNPKEQAKQLNDKILRQLTDLPSLVMTEIRKALWNLFYRFHWIWLIRLTWFGLKQEISRLPGSKKEGQRKVWEPLRQQSLRIGALPVVLLIVIAIALFFLLLNPFRPQDPGGVLPTATAIVCSATSAPTLATSCNADLSAAQSELTLARQERATAVAALEAYQQAAAPVLPARASATPSPAPSPTVDCRLPEGFAFTSSQDEGRFKEGKYAVTWTVTLTHPECRLNSLWILWDQGLQKEVAFEPLDQVDDWRGDKPNPPGSGSRHKNNPISGGSNGSTLARSYRVSASFLRKPPAELSLIVNERFIVPGSILFVR